MCLLHNCYVTVYEPDYVTVIRVLGSGTNEGSSPRSSCGRPLSLVPTVLINIISRRREVLIQFKNCAHTPSILEHTNLKGFWGFIIDISGVLIYHHVILLPHGSA